MEVLKAIQKAKEVKSKLNNPEKKVGLCVGGVRSHGEEPAKEGAGSLWNLAVECSGPLHPSCAPPCPICLTLGKPHPISSHLYEEGSGSTCHIGLLRTRLDCLHHQHACESWELLPPPHWLCQVLCFLIFLSSPGLT